jgi:feruloyl esterase
MSTVRYYQAVRGRMSPAGADSFSRLFMVPGMGHCLGGPGPNSFDAISLLEAWTEKGQAPEQMVAYKYDNDLATFLDMPPGAPVRSRPLCAWPKTARWTGTGSSDDAANWRCEAVEKP